MERLYREVICRPVEDANANAACARRLCNYHLLATRITRINKLCGLSLLEYDQVHIGLGHSAQARFQAPVPTVLYVVRSETDRMGRTYHPLSFALNPPRRNARTHTLNQLT